MPHWVGSKWAELLPAGSIRARLASGAFWSLIATLLSQGLGLVAAVITARLLGRVGFGELGIINSTVGTFSVFAGWGLGTTATRYVAELRVKDPKRAGRVMGLSIWTALATGAVTAVALFLFAPALAATMLNAPHLADELRLGCALLFFGVLNGAQTGALSGLEAFKLIAKLNLLRGLLYFPATVLGVWLFGLTGAIAALVLTNAASCALNEVALRRECRRSAVPLTYSGSRSELGILWRFSLPAFLAAVLTTPVAWAGSAALANQPGGYAELGLFNAANQWRLAILFLPGVLAQVLIPVLSSLYGEQRGSSYRRVLRANMLVTFLLSLAVAAPVILASSWIMGAYGSDFAQGATVLIVITLSTVLTSTGGVVGQAIISIDKMWHGFWLNAIWAGVFGLLVVLLVKYGAFGLALAYLISYVVHYILSMLYMLLFLNERRVVDAESAGHKI